jgi:hypothetical protein
MDKCTTQTEVVVEAVLLSCWLVRVLPPSISLILVVPSRNTVRCRCILLAVVLMRLRSLLACASEVVIPVVGFDDSWR